MRPADIGPSQALRRLAATLLATAHARFELATLEITEAGRLVLMTVVTAFAAILMFGGAVLATSAWIAVALWDVLGQAVLGWIALVYALGGAALVWWLRSRLAGAPHFLEDTIAELRVDAEFSRAVAETEPSVR